jgi:oxaloacetate decarboxylase gamma subunit
MISMISTIFNRLHTRRNSAKVSEQLYEAAMLLGVGMTVVFAFLSLLIGAIKAITWFVQMTSPPVSASKTPQNIRLKPNSATIVSPDTVAAISAAMHMHRRKHK